MRRLIRFAASLGHFALAILLVGASGARAQERPSGPAEPELEPAPSAVVASADTAAPVSARAWYNYRPGTAWGLGHTHSVPTVEAHPSATTPVRIYVSQSGWPKYTPRSAWAGYGHATVPTVVEPHAPVYVSQSGWATYAPSSAWTTYRLQAGWQSYEPAAARPMNMRQAHVSGPSPYADGLARSYHEYGTGRPVPLAKPWLAGSP